MLTRDNIFFLCVGLLLGSLFVGFLVAWQQLENSIYYFIYTFQGLIGGGLAFVGATSVVVYYLIKDKATHQRKQKFVISTLPIYLAKISVYATASARISIEYGKIIADNKFRTSLVEIPDYPKLDTEVISALSSAAIWVERDYAKILLDLLTFYQIHQARFEGIKEDIQRYHINQYMIPTIKNANDLALGSARIGKDVGSLYSHPRKGRNLYGNYSQKVLEDWLSWDDLDLVKLPTV